MTEWVVKDFAADDMQCLARVVGRVFLNNVAFESLVFQKFSKIWVAAF